LRQIEQCSEKQPKIAAICERGQAMHLRWYTCDFDSPQKNADQSALPYYGLFPVYITGNGAPIVVAEVKRLLPTQLRTLGFRGAGHGTASSLSINQTRKVLIGLT
jgi:hypothetical protein